MHMRRRMRMHLCLCMQLDPHLDPAADGPDVFILGLGSSAVLTFTPPDAVLASMGEPPRRRDPMEIPNSNPHPHHSPLTFHPHPHPNPQHNLTLTSP